MDIMRFCPKKVEWNYFRNMDKKHREQYLKEHPEYKRFGSIPECIDDSELKEKRQNWWYCLPAFKQDIIKSISNFDPDIFEQITGIKVE